MNWGSGVLSSDQKSYTMTVINNSNKSEIFNHFSNTVFLHKIPFVSDNITKVDIKMTDKYGRQLIKCSEWNMTISLV